MQYTIDLEQDGERFIYHFEAKTDMEALLKISDHISLDYDFDILEEIISDREAGGEAPLTVDEILEMWSNDAWSTINKITNDTLEKTLYENDRDIEVTEETVNW